MHRTDTSLRRLNKWCLADHVRWSALISGLLLILGILSRGDLVARAVTNNRMRLGGSVPADLELTSATDCQQMLAALDSGTARVDPTITNSSCLKQNTAFSDLLRLRLGEWYLHLGDQTKAQKIWQEANELDIYFLQSSASLINQDDIAGAQQALARVAGWSRCPSTELHLAGLVAQAFGQSQTAQEAWQRALELDSYCRALSARYHPGATAYALGRSAASGADWALAREAFLRCLELDPRNPFAWMRLGLAYLDGFGDPLRAEEALRQSLAYGQIDWAYYGLSRALLAQGREAEALDEMLAALKIDQSDTFRDAMLSLLNSTTDRQAMSSAYQEMVLLYPDYPEVLAAGARAAAASGQDSLAMELYTRALQLDENDDWRRSLQELTEGLP